MSSRPVLVEPRQAIYDYLDALLREIPEADVPVEAFAAAQVDVEAPVAVAAPAETQDWEVQDWDPTALAEPVALPELELPAEIGVPAEAEPLIEPAVQFQAETRIAPETRIEASEPSAPQPAPGSPPAWAQPEFQALLFDVGGLTLAVPLVKLHSVVPWTDQITPMPRQPAWCHGLLRYREHNVRVIDTAALVIPEDKRRQREPMLPRHVLVVGDGRWALSCIAIGEVIRLDAGAVKWRTGQGLRPWLAGTVRERLCALLDTEAFADMLAARH